VNTYSEENSRKRRVIAIVKLLTCAKKVGFAKFNVDVRILIES